MTTHFSMNKSGAIETTNLDGVTSATNGSAVGTRDFAKKTVFVNVSVNTGAVTVNIEASPDGSTWFNLRTKIYSAATGTDVFGYSDHFPFMRTTTKTQSNATVTTTITGGN